MIRALDVINGSATITVPLETLPSRPTVMALPTQFQIEFE